MNPMTPPIEEQQEVARELDSSCNHHQQSMNASSHEEFSSSSSFRGNKHALCVVGIGAGSSSRPPNEFTRDATGCSDRRRFTNWLTNIIPLPHCGCPFFGVQPFGPRTRLYQVWQGKNGNWILCVYIDDTSRFGFRATASFVPDIFTVFIAYHTVVPLHHARRPCGRPRQRASCLRARGRDDQVNICHITPEIFLLPLFSFMAIWFMGGFLIFHVYLIALNQVWFLSSIFLIQTISIKL
ncbi:hypothetical protein BHE74_00051678 [Ensete ventricosum]|nr:hypothetical protein BHE74_00051678 [Ensete ventricosum]